MFFIHYLHSFSLPTVTTHLLSLSSVFPWATTALHSLLSTHPLQCFVTLTFDSKLMSRVKGCPLHAQIPRSSTEYSIISKSNTYHILTPRCRERGHICKHCLCVYFKRNIECYTITLETSAVSIFHMLPWKLFFLDNVQHKYICMSLSSNMTNHTPISC